MTEAPEAGTTKGSTSKRRKVPSSADIIFDKTLDRKDMVEFEKRLLKAFVSCNISLNAVEELRFLSLFKFLRPAIPLPSRFLLSGRISDKAIDEVEARKSVLLADQKHLTLTLDGYKNARREHILFECSSYS